MGLLDQFGQIIYEDVLGRKDTRPVEFGLLDAWKFFIEIALEQPRAKGCVIDVKRVGDHFVVQQIILAKNNTPLKRNGTSYIGREIKPYNLRDDLIEFMNGETTKIMQLDTLTK